MRERRRWAGRERGPRGAPIAPDLSGVERQPDGKRRAAAACVEREGPAVALLDDPPCGVEASPVPRPPSLMVKNGSNTRGLASCGIPGPVWATTTSTQSRSRLVRTPIVLSSPIASIASSSRFVHTWLCSDLDREPRQRAVAVALDSYARALELVREDRERRLELAQPFLVDAGDRERLGEAPGVGDGERSEALQQVVLGVGRLERGELLAALLDGGYPASSCRASPSSQRGGTRLGARKSRRSREAREKRCPISRSPHDSHPARSGGRRRLGTARPRADPKVSAGTSSSATSLIARIAASVSGARASSRGRSRAHARGSR